MPLQIKQGGNTMTLNIAHLDLTCIENNDIEARELPSFEMAYRAKTGINLSGKNKTVGYVEVEEAKRQRKAGGGRKAKTIANVYYNALQGDKSAKVEVNLDCLLHCVATTCVDAKGKSTISGSVMKILLTEYTELNAKMIQEDFGYGKSQAYRILEAWKMLMECDVDITA